MKAELIQKRIEAEQKRDAANVAFNSAKTSKARAQAFSEYEFWSNKAEFYHVESSK